MLHFRRLPLFNALILKSVFLFSLAALLPLGTYAVESYPGTEQILVNEATKLPKYIKFARPSLPDAGKFDELTRSLFKMDNSTKLVEYKREQDQIGFTHIRYHEVYNGHIVEGAMIISHIIDGKIDAINGEYYPVNASASTNYTEANALASALQKVGARTYRWQIAGENAHLKEIKHDQNASWYPKGELVYCPVSGDLSNFRLAYKFDVFASEPLSGEAIYVDALSGNVIYSLNLIHTNDSRGSAKTKYSGTQNIIADSLSSSSYYLQESSRGGGIYTFNMKTGTSYASAVNFTDADNYWNNANVAQDQVAGDAHWGAEMTYDYYFKNYGRKSYDNNNSAIYSYVHFDVKYNNAYWDGSEMNYGDGDGTKFYPLTSLDVCGHEITHGVTTNTSNLAYQNESGAMNEGISDIFGTCIEFFAKSSSADWIIGKDVTVSGNGIRDMSAPKNLSQPNTYNGTNYVSTSGTPTALNDYNGVHTNSGIMNYWFYLVSQGGSGTNDNSNSYSVSGIGMKEAEKIAYRMAFVYLSTNSTFSDARTYSIRAAIDLFGNCSNEVKTVTNAWYAVGVGSAYSGTPLNGTYTIGGSTPDFTTFTKAAAALNSRGVCGPVVFNVRNGSYKEQVRIGYIAGASAVNTVTFQSQSLDSTKVIITAASASTSTKNYTLELDSANFITFNKITIQRTGTNTYANVINLMYQSSYNTFTNNVLRGKNGTSTSLAGDNSIFNSDGSGCSYNVFRNNGLHSGICGFYLNAVTYYGLYNTIDANTVDSFGLSGIYCTQEIGISITNNLVKSSSFAGSTYGSYGIRVDTCDYGFLISKNKVYLSANASYSRGIMLFVSATNSGYSDLVVNNFVRVSSGSSASSGIQLVDNTYPEIFNNNVLNNYSSTSGAAIYVDNGAISTPNDFIYNNNLVNKGGGYAFYINAGTVYGADYNNLYTSGTNLGYLSGSYTSLTAWQSGTGYDPDSKNVDPVYTSASDLHASSSTINNAAYPLPSIVPDDIDGTIRNPLTPDIGADEFGSAGTCMNGSYTIGGLSPSYSSFKAAVADLTKKGICGNVVFKVRNGTYTEQVRIGNIPGASSLSTITFQSELGDSSKVILQYASSASATNNYVVLLDTVGYVTFKQMTIKRTGSSTYGTVIDMEDGAYSNLFRNDILQSVKGGTSGTSQSVVYTSGSTDIGNTFYNNIIRHGCYGIINRGISTAYGKNVLILNNTIDSFYNIGIYLYYTDAPVIENNNITAYPSSATSASGINLNYLSGSAIVADNVLYVKSGTYGLYYNYGTATSSLPSLIANNFMTVAGSGTSDGIYLYQTGAVDFIYNNINCTSSKANSSAAYINAVSCNIRMWDNNLVNKGGGFALYAINNASNILSDYNNLYTSGSYLTYWNTAKYSSLSTHQGASAMDAHDANVDPGYTNATTNLHISNKTLASAGTPYSGVTVDIDGQTRSSTVPSIGADEILPVASCLNGTYTIGGTTPDYATITAAALDLKAKGVCGPVVFNIRDGSYREVVRIGSISGVSSTNTVTFQSQNGDSSKVILYNDTATGDYVLDLDSADWITVKKITIKRTSSSTTSAYNVVQLHDGASNNTFMNNRVIGIYNSSAGRDFYIPSPNLVIVDTANTFKNNNVKYGYEGFHNEYNQSNVYDGNIIDSTYARGIHAYYHSGVTIKGNIITNILSTYWDGIVLDYCSGTKSGKIYKNKIAVTDNNGISLNGFSGNDSKADVYDNFITVSGSQTVYGLNINSATYDNIYYNNISYSVSGSSNYAVYLYPGSSTGINLKDNNFVNSGGGYVFYAANVSYISSCSYNNLYTSGSYIANWNSSAYTTLANLVTGSSMNGNSKSVDPKYITSTDLHVTSSGIDNAGTPISGITDDIDDQARSASKPDIGADEFTAPSCLLGTYTIGGTSPDFATFGAAIAKMRSKGLCGPVVFNVRDGSYNEKISIGKIAGTSAINTITFQSQSLDSSKVILYTPSSSSTYDATIIFDTANNIIFNKLTIKRTGSANYGTAVYFRNGCKNVTVQNCMLVGVTTATGFGQATVSSSGSLDSNITINNNLIRGGYFGLDMEGTSSYSEYNISVTNNLIDSFDYEGIYATYINKINISNNKLTAYSGYSTYGISLSYSSGTMAIYKNRLDLASGGNGIMITNCSGTSGNPLMCYNNFISVGGTSFGQGIGLGPSTGYVNIYYNSVNLTNTNTSSWAIYFDGSSSTIKSKDNIFVNSGGGYCLSLDYNLSNVTSDYNDYYFTGTYGWHYNTTAYSSFSSYKTASSKDANSKYVDPGYTSFTNLHISSSTLKSAGTPISGITDDIDGQTRSSTPTMGADEISGSCLNGTYTIGGTSPDYATFTSAVTALRNYGICGPVVFNVRDGSYTEQIRIGAITGASSSNTITFQSQSLDSSKVILTAASSSSSTTNYTLQLDSATYITFKKMTIQRTGSNTYANVVYLTNNASYNNFQNNRLRGQYAVSTTIVGDNSVFLSDNTNITYSTFQNNAIHAGMSAFYIYGTSSLNQTNNTFDGNIIDSFGLAGLVMGYQAGLTITNNVMKSSSFSTSAYASYGVRFDNCDNGMIISKNKIYIAANSSYCRGLMFNSCAGTSGYTNRVVNNFITVSSGSSASTTIYIYYSLYLSAYYNNLLNNYSSTSGAVIYLDNASTSSSDNFVNNNMVNKGGGYAWYVNAGYFSSSNYNNLYTSGSYVGYYIGTNYASRANWNSATGYDAASKSVDPGYTSSSDLHVSSSTINNAGNAIFGITDDIDGDTRSSTTPDIGADEFTPAVTNDAGITSINSPSSPICAGTASVSATMKNFGSNSLTSAKVNWSVNGTTQTQYSYSSTLTSGSTASISLGNYAFTSGTAKIKVWTSSPNGTSDGNAANDTQTLTITVNAMPSATVGSTATICSGSSTSIGASSTSGHTYSWTSNPSGFTSSSSNPSVSPTVTTYYKLTETITASGCSKIDSVKITVNSAPSATVGSAKSICNGSSTSIGAASTSGHTYSWTSNPSGFTSTSNNPSVNPSTTTTYTLVEKITATGCTKKDSVTITVNPLPSASVASASAICKGSSISIGAASTSGHTYSWTSNPSGYTSSSSNPSVSPAVTTMYKLTESITAVGCSKSDSVKITVNPLPVPVVGSATSICNGASTTIGGTSTSGHTYSWTSNPSGFTSSSSKPSVSPSATTMYTLTETITATSCSAKDSVKITVNARPTPSVSGTTSVCASTTLSYSTTSNSGSSYAWTISGGTISSGAGTNSISVKWGSSGSGSLKVVETNSSGCKDSSTASITINAKPAPSITGSNSVCASSSSSYSTTKNTGNTYTWTLSGGSVTSGAGTNSVGVKWSTSGSGSIQVVEANSSGCKDSSSTSVTINALPAATVGSAATICNGDSVTLGAASTSGNTYSWTSSPSGFTSTASSITVAPSSTITYSLTETVTASGCTKSNSAKITVNPRPSAKVANDTSVCGNTVLNLGASSVSGSSYSWTSNPSGFTSSSSNPSLTTSTSSTTYYMTETITATGCSKTDSVVVTVKASPKAFAGTSQGICDGSSITLGASSVVGNTYSWTSNPSGFTSSTASPNVTPASTTTYYLIEKVTATGCSKTDSVKITVNPLPSASVGSATTICSGQSTKIGAASVTGSKYNWTSNPSGFTDTTSNPSVSPVTTTMYTLTETIAATGCQKTDSVKITVKATPAAPSASNNGPLCQFSTLDLKASTLAGATYNWTGPNSFSSTSQNPSVSSVTKADSGLYSVTVTSGGCTSNTGTTSVTVYDQPKASISGSANVCASSTQSYSAATTTNKYSWKVNGGTITSGASTSKVSITWASAGKGYVKLIETNSNGCSDSTIDTITINVLPSASTGSAIAICNGSSASIGNTAIAGNTYSWTSKPSGFTSTSGNPVVSPSVNTMYYLTETITATGCSKSDSVKITVNARPTPALGKLSTPLCGGTGYIYSTKGNKGSTYNWTVNGGAIISGNGTDSIAVKWNNAGGKGTVMVVETNANGCKDSTNDSIVVNAKPVAKFAVGTTCFGIATSFTDSSTTHNKQVWDFGDGNSSSSKNPLHAYATTGSFKVGLAIMNAAGCVDTARTSIVIAPVPNAHWTTSKIAKRIYKFNADDSTFSNSSYTWDFGDSSSSNGHTSTHAYVSDSTYKVILTLNNNGCIATFDSTLKLFTGSLAEATPENFNLNVYPNPFNENTTLEYSLSKSSRIAVTVYAMDGRLIATIAEQNQDAGTHRFNLKADDYNLSQGVYFIRMKAGDTVISKQIIRVK